MTNQEQDFIEATCGFLPRETEVVKPERPDLIAQLSEALAEAEITPHEWLLKAMINGAATWDRGQYGHMEGKLIVNGVGYLTHLRNGMPVLDSVMVQALKAALNIRG